MSRHLFQFLRGSSFYLISASYSYVLSLWGLAEIQNAYHFERILVSHIEMKVTDYILAMKLTDHWDRKLNPWFPAINWFSGGHLYLFQSLWELKTLLIVACVCMKRLQLFWAILIRNSSNISWSFGDTLMINLDLWDWLVSNQPKSYFY